MSDYLSPIQQISAFHFNHGARLLFNLYDYSSPDSGYPLYLFDADGVFIETLPIGATHYDYSGNGSCGAINGGATYFNCIICPDLKSRVYTNGGALFLDGVYSSLDLDSDNHFAVTKDYMYIRAGTKLAQLDIATKALVSDWSMYPYTLYDSVRAHRSAVIACYGDTASGSLTRDIVGLWTSGVLTGGPTVLCTYSYASNISVMDVAVNSSRAAVIRLDSSYVTTVDFYDHAGALQETLLPGFTYPEVGWYTMLLTDSRLYLGTFSYSTFAPTGKIYMWDIGEDGMGGKIFTPPSGIGLSDAVGTYFTVPAPYADRGAVVY